MFWKTATGDEVDLNNCHKDDVTQSNDVTQSYAGMEPWVRIQNQTFTNWVNEKLRPHHLVVDNLTRDMGDGISLCILVESLKVQYINYCVTVCVYL